MRRMSYVVLARKYRPRSFEEMVGQDHVVRALTHALEQQRLHHAYLFTGTRGIGKTTVSRILAKSLNCTGPDGQGGITARPCGVCSACREIDADRYIDYVELDAASNRSIDEIRELIERAAYKPTVGRFKVFMIDEAHQLTKDAFNALLKTLEEPPEYLKFVLATTDPEKMLPTVLSRCLQFNLRPMAPQTVAEHLARVLETEQVASEPGALRQLARAARGSMRDALSLTDQAIAYGGGRLEEAAVRAMLGSVDRRHAQRLVVALAARDGKAVLAECDGLRGQGLSAVGTLEEIARLLQQMAVEQAVPGALDDTDPDTEAARRLAGLLAADETQLLYSMCLQGRAELSLAPDEYSGLVMVLLRFMAFPASGAGGRKALVEPAAAAAPVAAGAVPAAAGLSSAATGPAPSSAPLLARVAEHAAVPAPEPASPARAAVPAPSRPVPQAPPAIPVPSPAAAAIAAAAAKSMARQAAETKVAETKPATPATLAARADDEPPPWMDEAPFEGEELVAAPPRRAAEPAAQAPEVLTAPSLAAPAPRYAGTTLPPTVTRTALGDRWAEVVSALVAAGSVAALVRELAMQAELEAVQNDGGAEVWRLRVERDTLRAPALADKLLAPLRDVTGMASLRLELVAGVAMDSPARRDAEWAAQRQHDAEQTIQADPLVRAMLAQFSTARIVPGSIKPV